MKKIALLFALIFTLSMSAFIFQPSITVHAAESAEEVQPIDTPNVDMENEDTDSVLTDGGDTNEDPWDPLPTTENGTPILPGIVDYSQNPELVKYLKKGDIIYEPDVMTTLIDHVALVVAIAYDETYNQEYVLILEAVKGGGVCYGVLTPQRFNSYATTVKRVKTATQAQINSAVDWACNQKGEPYALSLSKNSKSDNEDWYCSELVWAAYYNQGIYLDQDDNKESGGSFVWPAEINSDADLTTIMQRNQTTTVTANNAATHTITCNNETFAEKHTYITYNSSQVICTVCDYVHSHLYTYRSSGDGSNHRKVCACGISTIETCFGITSGGITTCKKCGQKITGFVPTITSEDDEEKNKKKMNIALLPDVD